MPMSLGPVGKPARPTCAVPSEGTVWPVSLDRDFRLAAALSPRLTGDPDRQGAQRKITDRT